MAVLVLVLGFLVLHVIQKLLNVLFAAFNNIFFKSSQALLTDVTLFISGIGFSSIDNWTSALKTSAFVLSHTIFLSCEALQTSEEFRVIGYVFV